MRSSLSCIVITAILFTGGGVGLGYWIGKDDADKDCQMRISRLPLERHNPPPNYVCVEMERKVLKNTQKTLSTIK